MNKLSSHPVRFEYLEKLQVLLEQLRGGLIVSCQAELGEPLYGSSHMAVIAGNQCGYDILSVHSPQSLDLRVSSDFTLKKICQIALLSFQGLNLYRHGLQKTLERFNRAVMG
jgi:hypothetical protein